MRLSAEDRELAAAALRFFAHQRRLNAPQPTSSPAAQEVYRLTMARAVAADDLAKRIEQDA